MKRTTILLLTHMFQPLLQVFRADPLIMNLPTSTKDHLPLMVKATAVHPPLLAEEEAEGHIIHLDIHPLTLLAEAVADAPHHRLPAVVVGDITLQLQVLQRPSLSIPRNHPWCLHLLAVVVVAGDITLQLHQLYLWCLHLQVVVVVAADIILQLQGLRAHLWCLHLQVVVVVAGHIIHQLQRLRPPQVHLSCLLPSLQLFLLRIFRFQPLLLGLLILPHLLSHALIGEVIQDWYLGC